MTLLDARAETRYIRVAPTHCGWRVRNRPGSDLWIDESFTVTVSSNSDALPELDPSWVEAGSPSHDMAILVDYGPQGTSISTAGAVVALGFSIRLVNSFEAKLPAGMTGGIHEGAGLPAAVVLAWSARDTQQFGTSVEHANWDGVDPYCLEAAIRMALDIGLPNCARELLAKAENISSLPASLQKLRKELCDEVHVERITTTLSEGEEASRQWIASHTHEFTGQWVAVKDGRLLASSPRLRDLHDAIQSNRPGVHIAFL